MNNSLYPGYHALMMEKEKVFAIPNFGPELTYVVSIADFYNAYFPLQQLTFHHLHLSYIM
jgi:hypothetical protein